MVMKE